MYLLKRECQRGEDNRDDREAVADPETSRGKGGGGGGIR